MAEATLPKPGRIPDAAELAWKSALIVLLTLLAYWPALNAGFIWDDDAMVTRNLVVQDPNGLSSIWTSTRLPDYFPLTYSSLWLEWRLWADNPFPYHLTNILLHAVSAVLLWRVLKRLAVPGAWIAALLFALHPVNAESVAWITQRKNTLAMLFFMLSFWLYQRFEGASENAEPRALRWYLLALAAFVLSLLSKTAAVTFPFVLLLSAWWRRGTVTRRDILRAAPFLAVAFVLGLVTVWFQYQRAIANDPVETGNLFARGAAAGRAVWFYWMKALLPIDLAFVYPRWRVDPTSPSSYAPAALLAILFVVLWRFRKAWGRPLLFGLGFYLLMLAPVAGFLKIYFQRYSLVADHYQYFSIAGIIALIVGIITRFGESTPSRRTVLRAAAAIAVAATFVLTWRQARIYHDPETLWLDTLAKNPSCWLAHNELGLMRKQQRDPVQAEAHFREGLQQNPRDGDLHYNLGNLLMTLNRIDEAVSEYQLGVECKPLDSDIHHNLAVALYGKGRLSEAETHFRAAVQCRPDAPDLHCHLGNVLLAQGKKDEAVREYTETLRLQKNHAEAQARLRALGASVSP